MSKSKIVTLDSLSLSNVLNEDSELIPLMTPEDEEIINGEKVPDTLPILPLRNTVLFPGVVIPITAGRDKSIELIKNEKKKVGISLKPKSKIELLENYLHEIDLVLIMSVEPGFGGQKFMPEVLEKTRAVRNLILTNNYESSLKIRNVK